MDQRLHVPISEAECCNEGKAEAETLWHTRCTYDSSLKSIRSSVEFDKLSSQLQLVKNRPNTRMFESCPSFHSQQPRGPVNLQCLKAARILMTI